jgi:hypothetical protein
MRRYPTLWQEHEQIGKRIWRDFVDTENVSGGEDLSRGSRSRASSMTYIVKEGKTARGKLHAVFPPFLTEVQNSRTRCSR